MSVTTGLTKNSYDEKRPEGHRFVINVLQNSIGFLTDK